MKSTVELVETASIQEEIYLSAIDLKVTDAEIAKLARSGVLVRIPRPDEPEPSCIRCWRTRRVT